jgi:acetolactate synthase I/III small subunit
MLKVLYLNVNNEAGVLARISSLFSGKGYNLDSLTVGVTNDPTLSRITLVCKSDDVEFEQIKKQLNKLIDIIKVIDLTQKLIVRKELAFIKISANDDQKKNIIIIAETFGAKIQDISLDTLIIELTDTSERIDHFLSLLVKYKIKEIARSGLVAMELSR